MYFTVFCVRLCKTILSHSFRKAADTTIINKMENLFIKLTVSHSIHSIKANKSNWDQELKLVKGEKLSEIELLDYTLFAIYRQFKLQSTFCIHSSYTIYNTSIYLYEFQKNIDAILHMLYSGKYNSKTW